MSNEKIVLSLIDSDGKPVAGAKVGTNVLTRDDRALNNSKLSWYLSGKEGPVSGENGEIVLTQDAWEN